MGWVVDCSLALAWGLPDERTSEADRFLGGSAGKGAFWVPALWWYELSNALLAAERRQRLSEADRILLIELYGKLPIQTDASLGPAMVHRLQALAVTHSLSAYDASYLELAERRGLGLATLDRRLARAAVKAGINPLYPKP